MTITTLMKALADETRLRILLLVQHEGELCVCELTAALDESQPKISRHLAQLRQSGVLIDRRQGQWIYYRRNPDLPEWTAQIVEAAAEGDSELIKQDRRRLQRMGERPQRQERCC